MMIKQTLGSTDAPDRNTAFYIALVMGALVSALGLGAAFYMASVGHQVTGMNNQVVWGLPHVFGVFMIVAAAGVLNVASIGTVFGKQVYKPRGPLSALLALVLLAAGLAIIMLDLGRPDRLVIAATNVNLTSVFGGNMIRYPVFFGLVGLLVWTLMDRGMYGYSRAAGTAAFIWSLVMTTGTGSIFAFVIARQGFNSAILAPMFIIMSFAWGLAIFLITQRVMYAAANRELHPAIRARMKNLLATFVAAVFYFVVVYHLTNLYFAKQVDFAHFILLGGGIITTLFWVGFFLVGTVVPLLLLFIPALAAMRGAVTLASLCVILGGLFFLFVFIVGGQVYPLDIFPGMIVSSSFFDGQIDQYVPTLAEWLLAFGGVGIAFTAALIGVRVLRFMPEDDPAKLKSEGYLHD